MNMKILISSLLMGGVLGVSGVTIKFVDDIRSMKNMPGIKGQLALVKYRGEIVRYVYDGEHWAIVSTGKDIGAPKWADVSMPKSCKEIKKANPQAKDGVYTIDPDGNGGNAPFKAYCDMTIDGGGWTLVAYAGTIHDSKSLTTGMSNAKWLPLIFKWGSYKKDSIETHSAFSRFDLFKANAKPSDEFMAKRTSNSNNIIIFPIVNVDWFGREASDGHFAITSYNRNIPYIKMTRTGNSGFVTRKNNVKWSYLNHTSNNYPGIDWNVAEGENRDHYGDFNTGLNHRSILYWETLQSGYTNNQWFHGSPLSLSGSRGPNNNVQDIEFYYRESQ